MKLFLVVWVRATAAMIATVGVVLALNGDKWTDILRALPVIVVGAFVLSPLVIRVIDDIQRRGSEGP